jgi:hypothetical protein
MEALHSHVPEFRRSQPLLHFCELHNDRPKTAETSAIRVSYRKSQKRFRDTPMFIFRPFCLEPSRFYHAA